MLHFGMKPPFSFKKFLRIAGEFVSAGDLSILKNVSISGRYAPAQQATLKKWQDFDTALRNELVKIRAARKHTDPAKYLRPSAVFNASAYRIAINAYRNPEIMEATKMLDRERWQRLDELSAGYYFDLDFLIVYALKLLILARWEKIGSADKPALLQDALTRGQG